LCDNKAARDTITLLRNKRLSMRQHGAPNMDIIKWILWGMTQIKTKNGRIVVTHIDSHQHKKEKQLSIDAKLNVDAEFLVTQGL
jgi:hypothetical protein